MWRTRKGIFSRSSSCLLFGILLIILYLLIHQRFRNARPDLHQFQTQTNVHSFIDRIRSIAILDQKFTFNISHSVASVDIPTWLNRYDVTHFFNFYWLKNEGYLWHLQRSMDFKQEYNNPKRLFQQIIRQDFHLINIFEYLQSHPEYGLILDTAPDPIPPLFPPLPQTSSSLEQLCQQDQRLKHWYPCHTRSEMILSSTPSYPVTYALYDVTIETVPSASNQVHYDEMIYLFNSPQQLTNETVFVRQILPCLIRLLALVPQTAVIVLPQLNKKIYISQYIDVLIERRIVADRNRFIEYNPNQIYHTNTLYSTSFPRSDLLLLNKVLIANKSSIRRELILIIRNNLDDYSFNEIVQIINQFEFPDDFSYLRIENYHESSYNLTQIRDLFQQARIIIGMPTNILSHIVWCLPRTHIIEIIDKKLTTDFYEISLQLHLNYWLAKTTRTNLIDGIDFRNLMMKVLINIDA
ncbi:unnamed protein product [Adineta ricciae]|uniref:Uncharacterized protein n=1 Tax=Adineta ricciae TaxID=249248 RepID=A0A814G423_ADIRI|nr:unnamed protein product [Adineta ricciae]